MIKLGVVVNTAVDGGGEAVLRDLYPALALEGICSTLIGTVPRWELTKLPSYKSGRASKWSRRHPVKAIAATPLDLFHMRRGIERASKTSGAFSAYHMHYKREQILATRMLQRDGVIVWTEHGTFPTGRGARQLAAAYKYSARRVSAIVCVSERVRRDLRDEIGIPAAKLHVIDNGVNLSTFRRPSAAERTSARLRFGLPLDSNVVLVACRLHPDKRVRLAIDATRNLGDVSLLICGDGPDRDALRVLARGASVVFTGHLRENMRDAYHAADCYLQPSGLAAREGLPMSCLEAAACGLPIVACSDSGLQEVLPPALYAEPSEAAVIQALRHAMGPAYDSDACVEWAASHDLRYTAHAYAELIRRLA